MTVETELWDWRGRIGALYARVRAAADPCAAWAEWCAVRSALFRGHPQSPVEAGVRGAYGGPHVFPYDPGLRFLVALEAASGEALALPAGADGVVSMQPFARTAGLRERLGGELTLFWIEGYGGGVFLPFADASSGAESFGGGRYLLDGIKGADLGRDGGGRAVLDFNFAYQPSCSYSERYVCPLAPAVNRLPGAVRAGERVGAE